MSEILYGRVSPALKRALTAYAEAQGRSLNATVVELLERALGEDPEADRRGELEADLAAHARELEAVRARLEATEARLALAKERQEERGKTLRALSERARQKLGECPLCRKPVSGRDYLVQGRCPHCQRALTALLSPRLQRGAPEQEEYLALLGALGVLVALAESAAGDALA